jgi:hypothetical protein
MLVRKFQRVLHGVGTSSWSLVKVIATGLSGAIIHSMDFAKTFSEKLSYSVILLYGLVLCFTVFVSAACHFSLVQVNPRIAILIQRHMVSNNKMRRSDTIHFFNMPDNGLLNDPHDSQTLLYAISRSVRPRKRLCHKVSPVVVEAINVGLRIKLVKGPMQRFMA